MFPGPRSIIKFPDSARNRNPEEYKGTVFYRTFVLLAPFYNSATCYIYIFKSNSIYIYKFLNYSKFNLNNKLFYKLNYFKIYIYFITM